MTSLSVFGGAPPASGNGPAYGAGTSLSIERDGDIEYSGEGAGPDPKKVAMSVRVAEVKQSGLGGAAAGPFERKPLAGELPRQGRMPAPWNGLGRQDGDGRIR